jgi:hypothetical protein
MIINTKKFVGVSDHGQYIYWQSIASSMFECRRIIYDNLYAPFGDKPDWSKWDFVEISIQSLNRSVGDWQPIETAPKDATEVLGWNGYSYLITFWGKEWRRWEFKAIKENGSWHPTHWMPLPNPPKRAS